MSGLILDVRCPFCLASPDEPCIRKRGFARAYHVEREVEAKRARKQLSLPYPSWGPSDLAPEEREHLYGKRGAS